MFLTQDKEQSDKELFFYSDSLRQAINAQLEGNFSDSATHLQNAIRSLDNLQRMKSNKASRDQAMFILGQIEADRSQHELLRQLVKVYE